LRIFRLKRFSPVPLLMTLLLPMLVSGCGEAKYILRYEQPSEAKIWPQPPDKPRYRYVGQLTGVANLKLVEEAGVGKAVVRFLKAVVGLGSESEAEKKTLNRPQCGVVDSAGRILVTDAGRASIFVFDPTKGKLDVWQEADDKYDFKSPVGIAQAKNGDILVADSGLKRIIRLDVNGKPKGSFGSEDLERPTGLAVDPATGRIFVSDTVENNIKVYDKNEKLIQIIGQLGIKDGEFNAPTHIAYKNNNLYVTDTFNARIQVFDSKGKFVRSIGKRGQYIGNLVRPKGVTADSEGNVYIIESFNDYLLVYDQNARFLLPIGGTGAEVGQFYLPAGVWSDHQDRIYVADMFNGRVVIFQYLQGKETGGSDTSQHSLTTAPGS
jgi:DNA-binding beta-propeller fold protein YncE